ncbi:DUF6879 family protein [Streptomyces sp. NPDC001296]
MPSNVPPFGELLAGCAHSAVHLEMRDVYAVGDEADDFNTWLRTGQPNADPSSEHWASWVDLVSEAVARGVVVRRVRIVSEPVSDYIRYEHSGTTVNLYAGEQVRWLPRRHASDIALPGNDFWLFDDQLIRWGYFSGDGASAGHEMSDDSAAAKLCAQAFEAVWERGIPHDQYEIH